MRMIWFVGGAIAGVVAATKARNAAYRLSVPGLVDQANALRAGARVFNTELRDGMAEKEAEFRHQLLAPDQRAIGHHRPELEPHLSLESPHDPKERH